MYIYLLFGNKHLEPVAVFDNCGWISGHQQIKLLKSGMKEVISPI